MCSENTCALLCFREVLVQFVCLLASHSHLLEKLGPHPILVRFWDLLGQLWCPFLPVWIQTGKSFLSALKCWSGTEVLMRKISIRGVTVMSSDGELWIKNYRCSPQCQLRIRMWWMWTNMLWWFNCFCMKSCQYCLFIKYHEDVLGFVNNLRSRWGGQRC